MLFITLHFLLTFVMVMIACSDVHKSGKHRREVQIEVKNAATQNHPTKIHKRDIERVSNLISVRSNKENIQLIGPPVSLESEENVQQVTPNKASLHENLADVPDLGQQNNKMGPSIKTEVAQKVQYVQDQMAVQWPLGLVQYVIDKHVYDDVTIKRIVQAMNVVESSSCVLFKELKSKPSSTSGSAWLDISNPTQERECVHETSPSEFNGITVVLGFECLHPNEILHSILHAIGFKDEVSHPQRDQYIRIMWENIQPKYRQLFRTQFEDAPYKLVEYDPLSIMHFHDRAFSSNGAATIAPRIPGLQIGSSALYSHTLSQLDVMKLKLAFGHECNKRKIDDLLDTCKKVLLTKDRGNEDSNDLEENHENKDKEEDLSKDEDNKPISRTNDPGDSDQDESELRKVMRDNNKRKANESKALNEKDTNFSKKVYSKKKGEKESQRRGRYSYRRRG